MAAKYEQIATLFDEHSKEVARGSEEWSGFLDTAARLYKYQFNEQLLIHAKRTKEAEARAKKRAMEQAKMDEDLVYAEKVLAKRREAYRRHSDRRKVKLVDMKMRAESGDPVAIKRKENYLQGRRDYYYVRKGNVFASASPMS